MGEEGVARQAGDPNGWSLRRRRPVFAAAVIVIAVSTLVSTMIGTGSSLGLPTEDLVMLLVFVGMVGSYIIALVVVAWDNGLFHDRAFRCGRFYDITPERVDTAVGLLLASRKARFDRKDERGRFWKARRYTYEVTDLEDDALMVIVGPHKGGGTDLVLHCDIEDEGKRGELQAAIDVAVDSPYELDFAGALRASEPPELHVFEE